MQLRYLYESGHGVAQTLILHHDMTLHSQNSNFPHMPSPPTGTSGRACMESMSYADVKYQGFTEKRQQNTHGSRETQGKSLKSDFECPHLLTGEGIVQGSIIGRKRMMSTSNEDASRPRFLILYTR